MKTFLQVLEGADYSSAKVVALIDAPTVVQAVREALAKFFQTPHLLPPDANGDKRTRVTYMKKYGKTLKALAAEKGLTPSVVSTRLRRGYTLKEALRAPKRVRRAAPAKKESAGS